MAAVLLFLFTIVPASRVGLYGTEEVLDGGKVHLPADLTLSPLTLTLGPEGVAHDEVGDVLHHGVLPRLHEVQVHGTLLLQLLLLLQILLLL